MCECCGHGAQEHITHIHVQKVNCGGCLGKVQQALENAPGVLSIEHLTASKEAQVNFDSRIMDKGRLEKIINLAGFEIL